MSLVDYSSDDEDEEENQGHQEQQQNLLNEATQQHVHSSERGAAASSSTSFLAGTQALLPGPDILTTFQNVAETSFRLPNASELLSSFDSGAIGDPFRAPAMVSASASKKRPDLNGSADARHAKIPKGNLPPLRTPIDTAGGFLIPPQLRGRSNVSTEDLDKLFSKQQSS